MPTAALLFDTLNAYLKSAALKAAIELDVFTAIGEGQDTVAAIAQRIGGTGRATRILCDYLTILGFLEKPDSHYRLTPDSAMFLDRRSRAYLGSMAGFLTTPVMTRNAENLAEVVRHGLPNEGTVAAENPIWEDFARCMAPLMELPSRAMAEMIVGGSSGPIEVLDIAAGHGLFGIAVAQANPQARITALDWPGVLVVAGENAARRGVGDRYRTLEGSAFDVEFGGPYDVVLLTNFLHHFNPETNIALLSKVRAALKDGGVAVTLEFVPNEDRLTPLPAAAFPMNMLHGTQEGDAYTFTELERMFHAAGFSQNEMRVVPPGQQNVILSRV
jgi:ubiquinone/menaquinone biosynthesis C-methylase UbiE